MPDSTSFHRYTDSSRRALAVAQEEARALDHAYIGPEHVLLGLVHAEGAIEELFIDLGTGLRKLRRVVVSVVGRGAERREGPLPLLAAGQKVLSLAASAAERGGSDLIHPEHLLRGVLNYTAGAVPLVLKELGVHAGRLLHDLEQPPNESRTPQGDPPRRPAAEVVSCAKCGGDLRKYLAWTIVETHESTSFGKTRVRVAYCTNCGTAVVGRFDDPDAASPAYV